jgi:hypothetical protein
VKRKKRLKMKSKAASVAFFHVAFATKQAVFAHHSSAKKTILTT